MDRLQASYRTPQAEFSPVATWWWSGDRLEAGRLSWQLREMARQGIHNIVIISLAPVGTHLGTPIDEPRTFSDAWWELFVGVCAEARVLGIRLWMYDQIGFSSANFQEHLILDHPDFEGRRIERHEVQVDSPATVRCPTQGTSLSAIAYPQGEADRHQAEQGVPLPLEGDAVHWVGGTARICVTYTVRRGFDYYNPDACAALRDIVLGEFERRAGDYFGDVIVGTFQDELDRMPSWSDDFAAAFAEQHGYDLVPRLSSLWEGESLADRRLRVHYQQTRDELAERSFFRPFFAWHEERGLTCGFDQKYPGRAGQPIGSVELYGDYFSTQRWYGAPGSDHGGETKIHSSMAHLYERPRVWLEAFHSTGWGGTLEETFDWLVPRLRAGATLYNPHAVYYSTQQGWWEWAPPSTCWRQPYWRHYRGFADAVTRACSLLSQGIHRCDVALLYPNTTVQAGVTNKGPDPDARAADVIYERLVGRHDMVRSNVYVGVLDAARRDFDIVDEASLERATEEAEVLTIGSERYRAVVLPHCTLLPAASARMLTRFVDRGGVLIAVGTAPQHAIECDASDGIVDLQRQFDSGAARLVASVDEVPAVLDELCARRVEAPVPTLLREVDGRLVLFVPAAYPGATRHKAVTHRLDWEYSFDPARYAESTQVLVRGAHSAPQLWDLLTGECRPVPSELTADGVLVTVPFEDAPAALLVWPNPTEDGADAPAEPRRSDPGVEAIEVDDLWSVEVLPTVDRSFGDDPQGAESPDLPVQTWSFEHTAIRASAANREPPTDDAPWRRVRATFGTYGWNLGPMPVAELPDPVAPRYESASRTDAGPGANWQRAVYSLSHGLAGDTIHQPAFGTKGVVPHEFLHFGTVGPGQGVQHRTSVWADADHETFLVIGSPAVKQAWVNGEPVGECADREHWMMSVLLRAGRNDLEFRLTPDRERMLRAYWTLVERPDAFDRPEWLCAPDEPAKDTLVTFARRFDVPSAGGALTIQVGVDTGSASSVWLGDRLLGRQSGRCRVERYEVDVAGGSHEFRVEVLDPGPHEEDAASVLIDGVILAEGSRSELVSDATWTVTRDDADAHQVRLMRHTWTPARCEPSTAYLYPRAHPLTRAHRGAGDQSGVREIAPDALPDEQSIEWLRWTVPPGATAMDVPVRGEASLIVDGATVPLEQGLAVLPEPTRPGRRAVLSVRPERGRTEGALLDGPVTYQMGPGTIALGDWAAAGLDSYSGGLWYRQQVRLDRPRPGAMSTLDLGSVRGTAEVRVNGATAGVRIWSPYLFDISGLVHDGDNLIEILVLNTLAPALSAMTPTPYVFPGQNRSGLFGPVRVLMRAKIPTNAALLEPR